MESSHHATFFRKNNFPLGILFVLCFSFLFLLYASNTSQEHIERIPQDAYQEAVLDKEETITLEENVLFITQNMLEESDFMSLRPYIIRQLIVQGFTKFITLPYAGSGNQALTSISMGNGYEVISPIIEQDDLDMYLQKLSIATGVIDTLFISEDIRGQWSGLYLFKTTQDLKNMGYQVVSHRTRTNKDEDYRRFNITQSFALLGNVKILFPGETLDFMIDAQYDHTDQKNYLEGYVIVDGKEIKDYGGGMCGASTAIYQGILTNTGLKISKLRNHSKRFSNLYTATINHERITTPGIDSAVYYGQIDLTMKNITPNPIILVMNYDGSYGGEEEVFTLSLPANQGTFEFIRGGKKRTTTEIDNPDGTGKITQSVNAGGCYTRLINGKEETNCYKEIW